MMRVVCLIGALIGLAGCIYVNPPATCQDLPQGGMGLEPGDRVLARWRSGFWQATVIRVQGKLVTVAWDVPPPKESFLPRGWVAKKSLGPVSAEPGDWLLCKRSVWELCRLERVAGERYEVLFAADGAAEEIDNLTVAPVPEDLRPWAKSEGEASLDEALLAERVNPKAPKTAGTKVVYGQLVLARWTDGNWYVGKVSDNDDQSGATITVAWADGSKPLAVPKAVVAPLPTESQVLATGDLAFCKWRTSQRWWRSRIDRVEGDEVTITYRDGSHGKIATSECLAAE